MSGGNMNLLKKSIVPNTSLKTQLITVLVGISAIPVIFVGVFLYCTTIKEIKYEKINSLKAYSEGIASNIDLQIANADKLLKGLSSQRVT